MAEHPGSAAPTRIDFRFEPEDYVALSRVVVRRPLRRVLLALAIYVAIGALAVVSFGGDLAAIPWWIIAILVVGALLALFNVAAAGLIARLTYRRNRAAGQQMTLIFDETAVGLTLPYVSSSIAWSAVQRLVETPTHAILVLSGREGIAVPRRAFAKDADYAALIGFVRERLAPGS